MKKLIRYLNDYKKECILAPLLKATEALFELLVPLVIAGMIDVSIPAEDIGSIISKGFILFALAIVGIIVSVLAQYFSAKAAVGFAENLRHDLFAHILDFSFSDLDKFSNSTLINRLVSDVNSIQTGVNMILRLFLRSPFIVIGATVMAATIDLKASLIFISLILILFIIVYVIVINNIKLLSNIQKKMDALNTHIRANLNGTRVIRAFVREERERGDFAERNNNVKKSQVISGRISALLNPVTYVTINLFIVYLINFGAIEVKSGLLTAGQVVALYNYMSQILVELVKFANLIITVNKAFAGAIRINEVFNINVIKSDSKKQYGNGINNNDIIVSFKAVSLNYHGEADEALSNISFDINKGETVGIIGSTGSGKSSLVHALMGYYPISNGSIDIFGTDVKIAIVMQKVLLFKGSVADNLRFGKDNATEEEMLEALNNACCLDTVKSLGGLDAMISSGGSNLSGGQKQRLSIARSLISKPDILILDDSSSALDYLTDSKLKANLKNLSNKPTVITISQRIVSIKDSDKIIVLDDGNMCGIGTHEELLNNCDIYKEIYNSQV